MPLVPLPVWERKAESKIKGEPEKPKLHVKKDPVDARVRRQNIRPRFRQGMGFSPGQYLVEVSAEGYETEKGWRLTSSGDLFNRRGPPKMSAPEIVQ